MSGTAALSLADALCGVTALASTNATRRAWLPATASMAPGSKPSTWPPELNCSSSGDLVEPITVGERASDGAAPTKRTATNNAALRQIRVWRLIAGIFQKKANADRTSRRDPRVCWLNGNRFAEQLSGKGLDARRCDPKDPTDLAHLDGRVECFHADQEWQDLLWEAGQRSAGGTSSTGTALPWTCPEAATTSRQLSAAGPPMGM